MGLTPLLTTRDRELVSVLVDTQESSPVIVPEISESAVRHSTNGWLLFLFPLEVTGTVQVLKA